jgi:hypothetical protein
MVALRARWDSVHYWPLGSLAASVCKDHHGRALEWMPVSITLPFVSYGGSSVVANFLILGLLLRISHEETPSHA